VSPLDSRVGNVKQKEVDSQERHHLSLAHPILQLLVIQIKRWRNVLVVFDCFVGIDLGREPVPESKTIARFRKLLDDSKLGEALFARVGKELQTRGFKFNTATIICALSSTKNVGMKVPTSI
jgi:hypothetical protein